MKVTTSTGEEVQMVLAKNAGNGKGKTFLPGTSKKYGAQFVTVTQTLPDMERFEAYRRKTAAFEEWREKLNKGDRLPRGRFFKGKRPGRKLVVIDEFWQAFSKEERR
ncbi:hypothetical protein QCD61_28380 (plasmid) [Pseudomonas viciae]|uniref:Uncharacterized protein n=1 Tax=Pseudomonas viciae TaxID=2505979 RepID=A0ABY8PMP4_9PSED|nr:hypothetical protein [Pseudomonas viciae]WGO96417.1 hypothetical protein QCD61_28380 [Pseudomonas viciae]